MDNFEIEASEKPLIITHGGTIINIISWWLKLDLDTIARISFRTSPASISVLTETELKERRIERLNDTAHLYSEGLPDRIPLN
jgi:broad specificity phosphatase PhoE